MAKRLARHIGLSDSESGPIVGFFWRELENAQLSDMKDVTLDSFPQVHMQSVQEAVNKFLRRGAFVLVSDGRLMTFSVMLDSDPKLFDMIVDSPEPAQTLISRYVLEG